MSLVPFPLPGWASVRLALKLTPYAVIAILSLWLAAARADLAHLKANDKIDVARQHLVDAQTRLADVQRMGAALSRHTAADNALQPIILHSVETVTRYAQTPAGRLPCLSADRVRGIDDLDTAILAADAAGSGDLAVSADASASPGRRGGDIRR